MANNKFLEETGLSRFWAHVKKFAVEQAQRPNDNLLTNSDFKSGIINQKGQTSYGYVDKPLLTIDMWLSYGVNVAIDVTNVRAVNRQTSARTLRQYINGDSGVYTVYVNVKTISGNVYVNLNNDTSKNKKLAKGENKFQITVLSTESLKSLALYLEANADVYIYSIKLEKGSHFTGMPAWNEGVEFAKCINKYRFELNNYYPIYEITGNKAIIPINHNGMDKKPSVIVDGGFCKGADGLTATFTSYKVVENKDNSTTVEVTFNKNIQGTSACLNVIIDSYDY